MSSRFPSNVGNAAKHYSSPVNTPAPFLAKTEVWSQIPKQNGRVKAFSDAKSRRPHLRAAIDVSLENETLADVRIDSLSKFTMSSVGSHGAFVTKEATLVGDLFRHLKNTYAVGIELEHKEKHNGRSRIDNISTSLSLRPPVKPSSATHQKFVEVKLRLWFVRPLSWTTR